MFSIFRRNTPATSEIPVAFNTRTRREYIRRAMQGASHYEQEALIRMALDLLPRQRMELLVQSLDREIWMETKP